MNLQIKKQSKTFSKLIRFELTGLFSRTFFQRKPGIRKGEKNLLHLGCGKTKFEGWVNADFFGGFKPWKRYDHKPDWMLDLRFPLNCANDIWAGVFTEHTIEHLRPAHAQNLLDELNRTLKPGAWIRITVPDLKKYINYYKGDEVHERFLKWQTGCEAIGSLTQDHGHLSVWDSTLLSRYLANAGFINMKEVAFMQGTEKLLLKDRQDREWETLYMEAQKPLNAVKSNT